MSKSQIKTVYFVRHGQSVDNISPVFQSLDSPLSPTGEKQAGLIAGRLSHVNFDTLIASPVKRAKQTAEAIAAKTGKEIVFSDLFVENIKPSSIAQGAPWTDQEAQRIWAGWGKTRYDTNPNAKFEDGENYVEILQRADAALQYLLDLPEQTVVAVTHGYFLKTMIARALFDTDLTPTIMERFQTRALTENTAITALQHKPAYQEDHAWRLWTFNDHAHFAE